MTAAGISAAAAVVAAIISVIAVFIASRSAAAAKKSSEIAAAAFQRTAIRELLVTCREVVAENQRIESLCIDLRTEYTGMFNFAGVGGGGAEKQARAVLDRDIENAKALAAEGAALSKDTSSLLASSGPDIDARSTKIGLDLVELRTIRESIERRLNDARSERKNLAEEKR